MEREIVSGLEEAGWPEVKGRPGTFANWELCQSLEVMSGDDGRYSVSFGDPLNMRFGREMYEDALAGVSRELDREFTSYGVSVELSDSNGHLFRADNLPKDQVSRFVKLTTLGYKMGVDRVWRDKIVRNLAYGEVVESPFKERDIMTPHGETIKRKR